nr:MAG TPA: hypothetical protein [Caudoviricetes sp.]
MIRENVKKNIDIISAFAEGKTIQYKTDTGSWHDLTENEGLPMGTLGEEPNKFRIKPEQKFRPFKDAEECWNEMQKHQPFGWVKDRNGSAFVIENVDLRSFVEVYGEGTCTFKEVFENHTFVDGTPFGIKVEE